jgi:hypothetical protein
MNNEELFPHEKDYLHSRFFHSKDLKTFIEKATVKLEKKSDFDEDLYFLIKKAEQIFNLRQ